MAFHDEKKVSGELLKFPERYVAEENSKPVSKEDVSSLKTIYKAA